MLGLRSYFSMLRRRLNGYNVPHFAENDKECNPCDVFVNKAIEKMELNEDFLKFVKEEYFIEQR